MTSSEGGSAPMETPCRRHDCGEPAVGAGLCARHWARWQDGEDQRDLPDDTRQGPPRQVWQPPTR